MNTIHTISNFNFNRDPVPYTVIGGRRKDRIRKYSSLLTIVLLNRAGKFDREEIMSELQDSESVEVLCVEGPRPPYDIESRSRRYPDVRFLLLKDEVTIGERINLSFEEVKSRRVMVIWSDMRMVKSSVIPDLITHLKMGESLCTVPLMKTARAELIPTIMVPAFVGRRITVVPWQKVETEMKSIFPFDFCGVYDRDKFLLIGGYDPEIGNPYWQKMDFGFRTFLWGEQIVCDTNLEVDYIGEVPLENSTPDASYKVFYLKNIAVKYKNSFGMLPLRRCLPYMFHSDTGPLYSLKEFLTARKWIKENRMRFKRDSRNLVSRWEVPE